jgi:hypothetical protein
MILFLLLALIIGLAPAVFANSAEPPSILIIVPNAPHSMELAISIGENYDPQTIGIPYGNQKTTPEGETIIPAKSQRQWLESSFRFYVYHLEPQKTYEILITVDGNTSRIPIENIKNRYNNVYTLDWKDKSLTPDRSPMRSVLFVFLRVALTLIIEGLIFYLLGFRKKQSWMFFLGINVITQGALNIWLNSMFPTNGYIIFALVIGEFFVFLTEILCFTLLLSEGSRIKRAGYAFLANLASLVAGGYLITLLPL